MNVCTSSVGHPPVGPFEIHGEYESSEHFFPWELSDEDYMRRLLKWMASALRPVYGHAVACKGCPKVKQDGREKEEWELDTYYALKHVQDNLDLYWTELEWDEPEDGPLQAALDAFREVHEALARADLGMAELGDMALHFSRCEHLASKCGCFHIEANVRLLRSQWEEHKASKKTRKTCHIIPTSSPTSEMSAESDPQESIASVEASSPDGCDMDKSDDRPEFSSERLAAALSSSDRIADTIPLQSIRAAMRQFPASEETQRLACEGILYVLADDCKDGLSARECESLGLAHDVIAAIRSHRASADLVFLACWALGSIAEFCSISLTADGWLAFEEAIQAVMRGHRELVPLQRLACRAVVTLASHCGPHILQLGSLGPLSDIQMALRTSNPSDAQWPLLAIQVMTTVACNHKDASDPKQGLLEDLRNALRCHKGREHTSCTLIANIISGSGAGQAEAGRLRVLTDIQAAMRECFEDVRMQVCAFAAVLSICRGNKANRAEAGRLGLLEDIQAAMRQHSSNATLQEAATEVISVITEGNRSNQAAARRLCLSRDIKAGMRLLEEHYEVLLSGAPAEEVTQGESKRPRAAGSSSCPQVRIDRG